MSSTELQVVSIGGTDLATVDDAKVFLSTLEADVISASVKPCFNTKEFLAFWLGGLLYELEQKEVWKDDAKYAENTGGYYQYCLDHFGVKRNTVNKYKGVFDILTKRGVKPNEVIGAGIDKLALICSRADQYSDEQLAAALEDAREMNEKEFSQKYKISGEDGDKPMSVTLKYAGAESEEYESLMGLAQEHYSEDNYYKITLNILRESMGEKAGLTPDPRDDLKTFLKKHKLNKQELANTYVEVTGSPE